MAKKIGSQDLFEANLFLKEKENAEALLVTLQKLEEEYKDILKVNNEIIKQSDTKSVEGLKKREQAVKAVTTAEKEMQKIEKALVTAEEKLNLSRSEANKKLQETRVKTNAVNKELRDNAKRTLESGNAYKKLSARVNDASAKFKRLAAEFGVTSKQARKAKKELDLVQKELREIDVAAKDGRRNVGNYGSALGGIGKSLKGVGMRFIALTSLIYGLGRAIASSFRTFRDFQQGTANLAAVMGKSRKEIKPLIKDAKRLGATTAFTASQVTELQVAFSKLGFTQNEILNATEATLALAAATGTDLEEAATVAASTINAFGLGAEETQRVVDVMAKSFSSSALDMSKFSTAMATVGPVAKTAGLSIERTTALLGTLVDAGIDASTAGTGLRNIFLDLAKSGKTFDEAMQEIQTSTNKNATAMDLFGKRGATVATVLSETTEKADELEFALNNAGGAAQKMAEEQLDTLQGSITKLSSAWEGFILSMEDGEGVISDILKGLIDLMTTVIQGWTNLMKSADQLHRQRLEANEKLGSGIFDKQLSKIRELQQESNQYLLDLSNSNSENAKAANFILKLREKGFSALEQELFFASELSLYFKDAADNIKDAKGETTEWGGQTVKLLNTTDKVKESQYRGIQNSADELLLAQLRKTTEEELLFLTKLNFEGQSATAKKVAELAALELQRRNDLEGVTEEMEEQSSGLRSQEKTLTGLAKLKKELADLEKLRSDILVENNGEITQEYLTLTKQKEELEKQIKKYEDIINNVSKLDQLERTIKENREKMEIILSANNGIVTQGYLTIRKETQELEKKVQLLKDILEENSKIEKAQKRSAEIVEKESDGIGAWWEGVAKGAEINQEVADKEKKMWADRLDAATQFYTTLAELSTARIDREIENIDRELEASRSRQEQLAQIANQGQLDAQQSLAAEIRREAELERQKQQLERRKIRRQTISKGLELLSANLNAGQNGGDAVATSIRQLTGFIALLSNLPGFYKGTENAPEGYAWTDEKGAEIHLDKHGNIKDLGSQGGARIKYLEKGDKILTAQESKIVKSQMGVQPHIEAREIRIQQRALSGQKYIVDGLRNVVKAVDEKPVQSFEYDEINKAVIDQMTSRSSVERKHQSNKPKFM